MNNHQKRRSISLLLISHLFLPACAQHGKPQTDRELKGKGMIVQYKLDKNASEKLGVMAVTDKGNQIFKTAGLSSRGGGTGSFGGGTKMSFPRWVRITWREGVDEKMGLYWTTGRIAGDYKIDVLDRIPEEVFKYVAEKKGRSIFLKFRIKDDGVLFAWAVQETGPHGYGWDYKLEGGDF